LSVVGPDQALIALLALSVIADPGISIWAGVDAWKLAKRSERNYRLKIYNRLSIYVLLVVGLNLLVFALMAGWRRLELLAVPYRVPTASMAPTLLPGEFVLVDQRLDRSSKDLGLRRGELVVLKLPRDKKSHVAKRVIGLPGDEVELRGMELYVNGIKLTSPEPPFPEGRDDEKAGKDTVAVHEKSDSGGYTVLYIKGKEREDFRISVPDGGCFVLGDNRDISADSRHWGSIALADVLARARIVYFSRDPNGGVRWGRIGKSLKNTPSVGARSDRDPVISR
jgi:signal peptidase I